MAGSSSVGSEDGTAGAFRDWCVGWSGCEGGDLGSPARPAVWVCGIEPGGQHSVGAEDLAARVRRSRMRRAPQGYPDPADNLLGSFRRRITKLLAALAGTPVADYRAFALTVRPFTRGSAGYARLNLYPVGFVDTNPARWTRGLARVTGFQRKTEYLAWCDHHRLPALQRRARRRRPSLVIGLGRSWRRQFVLAFGDPGMPLAAETLAGARIEWGTNARGTVVAIAPFPTSASGLQSDHAIEAVGLRLRAILAARRATSGQDA